jgi:hypothetical protein
MEGLQSFQSAGEALRIEMRPGAELRVSRAHGTGDLRLRLGSAGDWLQIDGGLALDDGRVIAMRVLLEAAKNQGAIYSWVRASTLRLPANCANALMRSLRSQVLAMSCGLIPSPHSRSTSWCPRRRSNAMRPGGSALERMRSTFDWVPAVPSTLCAELRPYPD